MGEASAGVEQAEMPGITRNKSVSAIWINRFFIQRLVPKLGDKFILSYKVLFAWWLIFCL